MSSVQLFVICGAVLPGFDRLAGVRVVPVCPWWRGGAVASDARASFGDAAGRESAADLALVRVEYLVSGLPWRVVRWSRPDPAS